MKLNRTYLTAGIGVAIAAVSLFLMGASMQRRTQMMNKSGDRAFAGDAAGKAIYVRYCADCHGEDGDGNGPDAHLMKIKPADFRTGVYEFKTTPGAELPTKADIVQTLELGVRTTAMLPQLQLDHSEMEGVAGYIMGFSSKFKKEKAGKPIMIPPAPRKTEAMVSDGKTLFDGTCSVCHGTNAEGDGPIAGTLRDYRGALIRPADLTERPLMRANTPKALYRTIAVGLNGTPMASFAGAFKPKQIWSIVYYLETIVKINRASSGGGMMGGRGMMSGRRMMGVKLVGEEAIGARIDMAAYRAWMMSEKK